MEFCSNHFLTMTKYREQSHGENLPIIIFTSHSSLSTIASTNLGKELLQVWHKVEAKVNCQVSNQMKAFYLTQIMAYS